MYLLSDAANSEYFQMPKLKKKSHFVRGPLLAASGTRKEIMLFVAELALKNVQFDLVGPIERNRRAKCWVQWIGTYQEVQS